MDQKVVDQLSLEAIPYYQEQLFGALSLMLELQRQVAEQEEDEDIIIKTCDNNQNEIYQHYQDLDETNMDDVLQDIQDKCLQELESLDASNLLKDQEIYYWNQQLDELEDEIQRLKRSIQLNTETNYVQDEELKSQRFLIADIHQELNDQEMKNRQTKQIIKRKRKMIQKQIQEIDEKMLLKQKKQEQKQLLREKNSLTQQQQINQLQIDKDNIYQEINFYLQQQESIIRELEDKYNIQLSVDQKQEIQQIVKEQYEQQQQYQQQYQSKSQSISAIRSEINSQVQRRACCGECKIF